MLSDMAPPDAPRPVMVFADIDNTLIHGASVYLFGMEAWRSGFIKWHHVIPALLHQRSFIRQGETQKRIKSTRERGQAIVAGHTLENFRTVGESAWRRSIAPKIFPEIQAILTDHVDSGHEVWLVTASPHALAEIIARDLGFAGALGTQLETVDDVFTGEIIGELLHGPLKAEAAISHAKEHGVALSDCYAYSDSIADVPLLEAVGHAVAVNPDHALLRHATERGWPIVWPEGTHRHQARREKKGREKR